MGLRMESLFTKLGHLTSKISFLIVQTEGEQTESYPKAFCNQNDLIFFCLKGVWCRCATEV